MLRLLARFFILSQSGLFFVARTFFNRYGFNCGEECSVDRSSNEAAAPKNIEAKMATLEIYCSTAEIQQRSIAVKQLVFVQRAMNNSASTASNRCNGASITRSHCNDALTAMDR